jgi:hypothetical protein
MYGQISQFSLHSIPEMPQTSVLLLDRNSFITIDDVPEKNSALK